MIDPFPAQNLEDFLRLLRGSQLLDDAVVELALDGFRGTNVVNGPTDDGRAFASYLVVHGYLTCWQCRKLRDGRFKGFFLDNYELRDHLEVGDTNSRFVAEDTRTGKTVILAVTPPTIVPPEDGRPHYTVEDYGE